MSSSNPFRNKNTNENRPLPSLDLSSIEPAPRPPPPTSFAVSPKPWHPNVAAGVPERKIKPVKKVRVVSPPPLSPDSPESPGSIPLHARNDDGATNAAFAWGVEASAPQYGAGAEPGEALLNPFGVPSQDRESSAKLEQLHEERREEGAALKAANSEKGGMDVDAFKRLLLTGDSGTVSPVTKDPSSEVEYGSRPMAQRRGSEDSVRKITAPPPPPPPSSRHGRALKTDSEDTHHAPSKPAVLEGEAHRNPAANETPSSKKPVPAPPPRRGHARAESRLPVDLEETHAPPTQRPESVRAPAPPPPRRPHSQTQAAATRASTPPILQAATNFQEVAEQPMHETPESRNNNNKVAPAPPPTRNKSVRRPPSIQSIDSASRRVVGGGGGGGGGRQREGPPPPPSRSRNSDDSMRPTGSEISLEAGEEGEDVGPSILADLSALQREVDALRGKLHN